MHGNLHRSLSVLSFRLIYLGCSLGFHSPQYLMPTLPVVGCRQVNGVGRFEI